MGNEQSKSSSAGQSPEEEEILQILLPTGLSLCPWDLLLKLIYQSPLNVQTLSSILTLRNSISFINENYTILQLNFPCH